MRTSFLFQLLLFAFFFIASCNENPKGVNNKRDDNTNKNRDDNSDNNRDDNNNRDDENRDDNRFSLIGKWSAEIDKSPEESDEKYITTESQTVEFTSDGRYISKAKYPYFGEKREVIVYGTYTFNKRTKTLVTISDEDKKETADVEFLGKNKIILTASDGVKVTLERN